MDSASYTDSYYDGSNDAVYDDHTSPRASFAGLVQPNFPPDERYLAGSSHHEARVLSDSNYSTQACLIGTFPSEFPINEPSLPNSCYHDSGGRNNIDPDPETAFTADDSEVLYDSDPDPQSSPTSEGSEALTQSSYYDFRGVHWDKSNANSATYMRAREARAQQQGLTPGRMVKPYPSLFHNRERLALTTPGSSQLSDGGKVWAHHPLIPGRTTTWSRSEKERGDGKGAVRSIYTPNDPNKFDVAYHDPAAGSTSGRHDNFVLARYHPARK
ncbi:hypothetical protein O1611_g5005 [Lasiodiplodia mahajangana]|uniref:Uncharacterized protein n=1 Tax=Lasiodiplodia mahajangana TaxID=1108764 RepID=A0ACC2JM98_9PEZI|nr:hypothetical protein O1611_g5005 [Lasiodiplodia mahajangana]